MELFRKKVILGCISFLLICFSAPIISMAERTEVVTGSALGNNSFSATGSALEIKEDIMNMDTVQYKVTLPTTSNMSFHIDPLGLYGYTKEHGMEEVIESKDLEKYKGKIIGNGFDSIVNKSSVDVVVACEFSLSSNLYNLTIVDSYEKITEEGNELCFNIVAGNVSSDYTTFIPTTDALFYVGSTATKYLVALPSAEYQYIDGETESFYKMIDKTETAIYFSIDGKLSANGNWEELRDGKTIKLTCVYSFAGVKDINSVITKNGFIIEGADTIEYLED